MKDPQAALQTALVAVLTADPGVRALVGGRVYDDVPEGARRPYITLGDIQTAYVGTDCTDEADSTVELLLWSQAVGRAEVRRMVDAVRTALLAAGLDLSPDHRVVDLTVETARTAPDPDGRTARGAVTLRVQTETTE